MERNTIRSVSSDKAKAAGGAGLNFPAYMQQPKAQPRSQLRSQPRAQRPRRAQEARKSAPKAAVRVQRERSAARGASQRRSSASKLLRTAVIALFVMLAVVVALMLIKPPLKPEEEVVQQAIDNGTFYDGIVVDGVSVGGMKMDQARRALEKAVNEKLDAVKLVLQLGEQEWELTREDLTISTDVEEVLTQSFALGRSGSYADNWSVQSRLKEEGQDFSVSYSVDEEILRLRLEGIVDESYVAPLEPKAVPDKGKVGGFSYKEGKEGVTVDEEALLAAAKSTIESMDFAQPLKVPTLSVPPKYTLAQIKLNTKFISSYSTTFKGGALSNKARVENIRMASEILNGAVIQPGENFSFNAHIGPRTEKGGWQLAPGIVNGNTYEMQAGGGICQVSTTFYNALLTGDFKIVDRKHHSWPSSYVPKGLDATVSTGGPDLVFQNNYDYPVYIFTKFEGKPDYKLTVSLYGPTVFEDGVEIKVRSNVTEETLPPEPLVTEDPKQPLGFEEVVITARSGYKVEVYKDYVKGDKVIKSELLYKDSYRAIRGEKIIGTGPAEMPSHPVPTPTPMP